MGGWMDGGDQEVEGMDWAGLDWTGGGYNLGMDRIGLDGWMDWTARQHVVGLTFTPFGLLEGSPFFTPRNWLVSFFSLSLPASAKGRAKGSSGWTDGWPHAISLKRELCAVVVVVVLSFPSFEN
jgi:hypothetical protein